MKSNRRCSNERVLTKEEAKRKAFVFILIIKIRNDKQSVTEEPKSKGFILIIIIRIELLPVACCPSLEQRIHYHDNGSNPPFVRTAKKSKGSKRCASERNLRAEVFYSYNKNKNERTSNHR